LRGTLTEADMTFASPAGFVLFSVFSSNRIWLSVVVFSVSTVAAAGVAAAEFWIERPVFGAAPGSEETGWGVVVLFVSDCSLTGLEMTFVCEVWLICELIVSIFAVTTAITSP